MYYTIYIINNILLYIYSLHTNIKYTVNTVFLILNTISYISYTSNTYYTYK